MSFTRVSDAVAAGLLKMEPRDNATHDEDDLFFVRRDLSNDSPVPTEPNTPQPGSPLDGQFEQVNFAGAFGNGNGMDSASDVDDTDSSSDVDDMDAASDIDDMDAAHDVDASGDIDIDIEDLSQTSLGSNSGSDSDSDVDVIVNHAPVTGVTLAFAANFTDASSANAAAAYPGGVVFGGAAPSAGMGYMLSWVVSDATIRQVGVGFTVVPNEDLVVPPFFWPGGPKYYAITRGRFVGVLNNAAYFGMSITGVSSPSTLCSRDLYEVVEFFNAARRANMISIV
ncbi:hypothetical protein BD626DRAFT_540226 [Schizophyllum amplum]|uniref:Uncharacterized protein n=1 Tax=Schizophyllum amplum TaxID=97359 RepID=A0A550BZI6_9AGAR|nr:hypothetical protein BD626DRAFT_540226 [Auriculariopsis ampla]